jgi:hypothetical protein
MLAEGFIGQRVELPRFYISLDLAIPGSCIKLSEPVPKLCEFLRRETGDFLLDGFEFTHRRNDTTLYFHGLTALARAAANRDSGPLTVHFDEVDETEVAID